METNDKFEQKYLDKKRNLDEIDEMFLEQGTKLKELYGKQEELQHNLLLALEFIEKRNQGNDFYTPLNAIYEDIKSCVTTIHTQMEVSLDCIEKERKQVRMARKDMEEEYRRARYK